MPVTAMAQLRKVIQDLRLLFYALGIFLCYLLFGVFQEKMYVLSISSDPQLTTRLQNEDEVWPGRRNVQADHVTGLRSVRH